MTRDKKQINRIVIMFALEHSPDDIGSVTYDIQTMSVIVQHRDTNLCNKVAEFYRGESGTCIIDIWDEVDGKTRRTYIEKPSSRGTDSVDAFRERTSELSCNLGVQILWDKSTLPD